MLTIILSFVTAFTLTYFSLPPIIKIGLEKDLCDEPGERSSHHVRTPSVGGIGIFAGSLFSIVMWTRFSGATDLQYIVCAFIIIFLIGVLDDIAPVSANKKMIAQVIAASILVLISDVELTSFYGFLGLEEQLPVWFYKAFSIFTILVIINAFNLIDGINGLAGSIGALIAGTLGCWFFMVEQYEFTTIAFAITGSVVAFLRYNFTPAKIFMGDSGSQIIGMVLAILIIKFIDLNGHMGYDQPYRFDQIPAVALGIMILPVYDTVRVFVTRILRGTSPFKPDRRHIHHLLIDFGFSHMQATGILVFVNTMFIVMVLSLNKFLDQHLIVLILFSLATVMTYILHKWVIRKRLARNLLT